MALRNNNNVIEELPRHSPRTPSCLPKALEDYGVNLKNK